MSYLLLFSLILIVQEGFGQFTQDTIPQFDSVTVENDVDIDSTFFVVYNRYGTSVRLHRDETDSLWNYWNHLKGFKDDRFYYTLGNTGSPSMNAYWAPERQVGFDHGVHHMDLHRLRSEDFQFFSTGRAISMLHYNQAPQQTKSETNVKLGRAFDKRSGISMVYDRVNDLGEFDHQRNRLTSVGVGMYYFPKPKTKLFFSYISNNFTLEENGGIQSYNFYDDPTFDDRELIPTRLNQSLSEVKEREARLTTTWILGSVKDTITNGLSIIYDGTYNMFLYKYSDPEFSDDFYQQYSVHQNGQRVFLRNTVISNSIGLSIDYGKSVASTFNGKLSGNIAYRWNQYEQDFNSEDINNILLSVAFEQQLSTRIYLTADGELDLGDQAGDYLLRGKLNIKPLKQIIIQGYIISQLKSATGLNQRLLSLESEIYNNNFSAASYNTIGGKIEFPKLGLSAEIQNTLSTDHVYFDSNLTPQRIGSALNIFQIKAGLRRQISALYTEHYVYLQNSDDDRVPLPPYFSKHYVGGRFKLFKQRLQLDVGVDGILLPDFDGYGYFPLTGDFYPVETTLDYNYTLNGLLGLRVDQFHVYFKFENFQTIWDESPRSLVLDHPLYDYRLRVGFRWTLRG